MRAAMLMCAAALVLMGCETKQDTGTLMGAIAGGVIGNQFGKGGGRVASTFAGAVIGGIVGNEIGRSLDTRDRQLAQQAEYDAWERGPVRPPGTLAEPGQWALRRGHPREILPARCPRLPRLRAQGLYRRATPDDAWHGLPQSRWHLEPRRGLMQPETVRG